MYGQGSNSGGPIVGLIFGGQGPVVGTSLSRSIFYDQDWTPCICPLLKLNRNCGVQYFIMYLVLSGLCVYSYIWWTFYQRVLVFRPSYSTAVELLYIHWFAIHIIRNFHALLYGCSPISMGSTSCNGEQRCCVVLQVPTDVGSSDTRYQIARLPVHRECFVLGLTLKDW